MKPQVNFVIPSEDGEMVLEFNKVEEIDEVIETLEMCRAELEHQIEMERQRRREKKKRAKMRKKENTKSFKQELAEALKDLEKFDTMSEAEQKKHVLEEYEKIDEKFKPLLKLIIDMIKAIEIK